jgi:hypothetical protein
LSVDEVNQIGRETGQSQRLRIVTPHRLFLSVLGGMAGTNVEALADLLREFNHQNNVTVAYKAFYNRLARPGFAAFMRQMFLRLIKQLSLRTLEPESRAVVSRFKDLVIQDGSSFALKRTLSEVFPGRFTTVDPAAVELHATYSGFADDVVAVELAPDCEAERQFLPEPSSLRDCLLLADRGYPAVPYFESLRENGGSFIVRLSRSHNPTVVAAWADGVRVQLPEPPLQPRLCDFVAKHSQQRLDLDVEYPRGPRAVGFRVIVVPGREQGMTRLCTNLGRGRFSLDSVARLYRFRWQVELCFKEWKSYANLHKFNTANEHIAEGLIWASLCAAVLKRFLAHAAQYVGGTPISTRRAAMCARHIIDQICQALLAYLGLAAALREGLSYLLANARRANPVRDRKIGRLRAGLHLVGVAS